MRREYLSIGEYSSRKFFSISTKNQSDPYAPKNTDLGMKHFPPFPQKEIPELYVRNSPSTTVSSDASRVQPSQSGFKFGMQKTPQTQSAVGVQDRYSKQKELLVVSHKEMLTNGHFQKASQYLSPEDKKMRVKRTRIAFQLPDAPGGGGLQKQGFLVTNKPETQKHSPLQMLKIESPYHTRTGSIPAFPVFAFQGGAEPQPQNTARMIRVKSRSMASTEFTELQLDSPRFPKPSLESSQGASDPIYRTAASGFRVQTNLTPSHSRSSSQSKLGSTQYMAFIKARREESLKKQEISDNELDKLKQKTSLRWDAESLPDKVTDLDIGFKIGAGSFAQVFEGFDKLLQRNVAVKVFENLRVINTPGRADLLQKEISTMSRLPPHENLCGFFRVLQDRKKVPL